MTELTKYLLEMISETNPKASEIINKYKYKDSILKEAFIEANMSTTESEGLVRELLKQAKELILKLAHDLDIKLFSFIVDDSKGLGQSDMSWVVSGVFSIVRGLIDIFRFSISRIINSTDPARLKSFRINTISLLLSSILLPFTAMGVSPTNIMVSRLPKLTALANTGGRYEMQQFEDIISAIVKGMKYSFSVLKPQFVSKTNSTNWAIYGSAILTTFNSRIVYMTDMFDSIVKMQSAKEFDMNKFDKLIETTISNAKLKIPLYLEIFGDASKLVRDKIEISGRRELVGLSIMLDNIKDIYKSLKADEDLVQIV